MQRSLLAILLTLGMAAPVWAGGISTSQDSSTPFNIYADVFNDSGTDLTSGSVVVWDNDDTEFDRSGRPFVTTTTTADQDWVAGVTVNPTCFDQTMCQIVVYGPVLTRTAQATDVSAEDTTVATSTVAGQAGDWGATANTCYLGLLMENLGGGGDNSNQFVFVNPGCED